MRCWYSSPGNRSRSLAPKDRVDEFADPRPALVEDLGSAGSEVVIGNPISAAELERRGLVFVA